MLSFKASIILFSSIAFGLFADAAFGGESAPEMTMRVECEVRGGLPNVLAKLTAGKEARIAYLGGSITAQPGWRVKSLKWLRDRYPKARISEINATVPGTGSDLGVFRLWHDVLKFKPDLVFVEFAVNDAKSDPAVIERCMEGIVRQIWKNDATADICFVYTISEPILADLIAGRLSASIVAMEHVADRYNVPSINMGIEVARLVMDHKVVFKSAPRPSRDGTDPIIFSEDGTHPLDAGHELYLKAFVRSWKDFEATKSDLQKHLLAAPLRADNYENARLLPVRSEILLGDWRSVDMEKNDLGRRFVPRLDSLWQALRPGARLEFSFTGSFAAVYDLMGPDCGKIEVQVDDGPPRKILRIDGYCVSHRLSTINLLSDSVAKRHRVRISLSAEAPDKMNILFAKNRPDLMSNPEKYANNYWYVGALMFLGDANLSPAR